MARGPLCKGSFVFGGVFLSRIINRQNKCFKIGINLVHLKPAKTAGIVAFTVNMLEGFAKTAPKEQFKFFILTSVDNMDYFKKNLGDKLHLFDLICLPILSEKVFTRDLFELTRLGHALKPFSFDLVWSPTYLNPIFGETPFIVTEHDLRKIEFPKNYSLQEIIYSKILKRISYNNASHIISISGYTKNAIRSLFNIPESKITVIYNPVVVQQPPSSENDFLESFGLEDKQYFYCVSSLYPEKNLSTLLEAFSIIKKTNLRLPSKLVISGIGGNRKQEKHFYDKITALGIQDEIIITGFVDDPLKHLLYSKAISFLFPSIYEGFGLPPLESLFFGTPVITTKKSAIPEVTRGQCIYVDNPFDPLEWIEKMKVAVDSDRTPWTCPEYDLDFVVRRYLNLFTDIIEGDLL